MKVLKYYLSVLYRLIKQYKTHNHQQEILESPFIKLNTLATYNKDVYMEYPQKMLNFIQKKENNMRKKLLTLMLALTLGITLAAMFIGCSNKQQDKDSTTTPPSENIPSTDNDSSTSNEHSHTYSEEWTTDETYHWHAATCEHISEVSDKAPHSWDSGKVTQKSTCTETGIYTYTCTVCGKPKRR